MPSPSKSHEGEQGPIDPYCQTAAPSQVKSERQKLAKYQERGLLTGVRIRNDGSVAFTSRGAQGRVGWMQYRKKVDYDAGYGDTYTYDGKFGD